MNNTQQQDLFGQKTAGIQIPSKETLLKYYEESWIDDWYPDKINKDNYRRSGQKMLSDFYESFKINPKIPKYLEQPFKIRLGDYKFKGRIDRADKNADGSIDIIDYKTGEPRTKLEKVDKDQLLIYQWAAQEAFKEKVGKLSYLYLKGGAEAKLEFSGTQKDIDELKEKLLASVKEIIQTIQTNSFYEKDLRHSHDCKYRDLEPRKN